MPRKKRPYASSVSHLLNTIRRATRRCIVLGWDKREIDPGMVAQQQQNPPEATLLDPSSSPTSSSPLRIPSGRTGLRRAARGSLHPAGWREAASRHMRSFEIRVNSRAMPSGGSTRSAHPAATAFRGIESYLAD